MIKGTRWSSSDMAGYFKSRRQWGSVAALAPVVSGSPIIVRRGSLPFGVAEERRKLEERMARNPWTSRSSQ